MCVGGDANRNNNSNLNNYGWEIVYPNWNSNGENYITLAELNHILF